MEELDIAAMTNSSSHHNFSLGGEDDDVVLLSTATTWEETFRDSSRFWVQRVLVPLVVIVGVLGNLITIYILTRKPMRSSTNVYLCALAVSDLLFLLFSFSMSLKVYSALETVWIYWWYFPFGLWLTDAASSTSVWLTVSFTIERYIAVCHPMRGKVLCTEERAVKVAVAVYLGCFAVTSPTPFEWTAVTIERGNDTTLNSDGNETVPIYTVGPTELGKNEVYRLVYHWFSSIFFIFLPLVVLAIFNFFLIQAVRHSRVARKEMTNNQHPTESARHLQTVRQENRITIILIVVVIVFMVCQLPTAIVLIYTSTKYVDHSTREGHFLLGLGNIFNLLVAVNASINFLLYTALSDKYRKYFLAFFPCCWGWGRRRRGDGRGGSSVTGRRARMLVGNNGDDRYEMDTLNTTVSLSRGTSLYNSGSGQKQPKSPYLGRSESTSRRPGPMIGNNSPGNTRHVINMVDPKTPLIQVEQV